MKRSIIVTGIGGVVGQGILRNLSDLSLDYNIIGVNIVQVSAGNYLCDKVYRVPYAYDATYISAMREICAKENAALIIPSTDYEAFYLADSKKLFSCPVAASPAEVTRICLDKYLNYQAFSKHKIPFAASFLPSNYNNEFTRLVVKPREGRGSRNIYINPQNAKAFDDSYVVQEFLDGPEITTSFYVTREKKLHGLITFVRELEQGNTSKAEVIFEYNSQLIQMMDNILAYFPFKGSCNVQSKVTSQGIIPFEINCRISGTNSIRSQFGFHDVKYTVQEYLLNTTLDTVEVKKGTALRVILDIIYPDKEAADICDRHDKFYIH